MTCVCCLPWINTAYRANELLSLRVRQERGLEVEDVIDVKQSKGDRYRQVMLSTTAIALSITC
jgi:hypothetical protein